MRGSEGPWPAELDAVTAAPAHHRVLLENDRVRVLETRIEPGDTTPLHTHRWPAVVYALSVSEVVRRGAGGEVEYDSRSSDRRANAGEASWLGALGPHTLENVGDAVVRVISVELKGG